MPEETVLGNKKVQN